MKTKNIYSLFLIIAISILGCIQKKSLKLNDKKQTIYWKLIKFNNNDNIKDTVLMSFERKGNLLFYINTKDTVFAKYKLSKFSNKNKCTIYIPMRRKYDYDYSYFPNSMVKNSIQIRNRNLETFKNFKLKTPIKYLNSTNLFLKQYNDTLIITVYPLKGRKNAYSSDSVNNYYFKKDRL